MEGVDNIIIDSLRNINCDIDEDITSLKAFNEDNIVSAIVCCLDAILPGLKLAKKMPTSMSGRLKYAGVLVDHIKSLGFRGDVGYQSILYANEIEIRRVLMFLIERLPRETSKAAPTEAIGYVPTLLKQIESKVRLALSEPWIPPGLLPDGARYVCDDYLQHSYGHGAPLSSQHLHIPRMHQASDELKDYWVHHLPSVSQQCRANDLIPSLLYGDDDLNLMDHRLKEFVASKGEQMNNSLLDAHIQTLTMVKENPSEAVQAETEIEAQIAQLQHEVEERKEAYKQIQDDVKQSTVQLTQLTAIKEKEDAILKEDLNKLKIKSRTLTVLSKEENMNKLKSLVENGNERLLDLANQWNEVQTPLIEQYRTLQTSVSEHELKSQEEQEKLKALKEKVYSVEEEFTSKEQVEKKLAAEVTKINACNTRASYTKRIIEIIYNIEKQDADIAKILTSTKDVQKEINTLTGILDRSFVMSDALIYKDAKLDEVARKSYKLLATLHMDCEAIVQAVTDVGLIERECRNVEEQIDAEAKKDIANKLQRVLNDIEELRKEGNTV